MADPTPGAAEGRAQPVLIHGLGRSGTSWLMKIFDHHPMVFASHEPERFVPAPRLEEAVDGTEEAAAARAYLDTLLAARPLRSMRKRPIRRKAYRSRMGHELRRGLLYGLSALERVLPGDAPLSAVEVPDLADLSRAAMVVKSVSHQWLLDRVMPHVPDVRLIYLIRHPCGNVHSNLQGQSLSAMQQQYLPARADLDRLYRFDKPAAELTESDFDQLEILAYRWAV
ncbi:MAG: sulfotransferase, partial [Pseudomonadota bacterium]